MSEDAKTEVKFDDTQQEFINKLVGDARIKSRAKAEAEFKAQQSKATEEAERANLAAKDEWQKLSATHEARVKELEPLVDQVKAYGELVAGMLKDRVKELGDNAKKAVDALPESMSAIERLAWLNKNDELFQEDSETNRALGTPRGKKKTVSDKDPWAGHKRIRL